MSQIINVYRGEVDITIPLTVSEELGADLTASNPQIMLGGEDETRPPLTWLPPTTVTFSGASTVSVQLRIGLSASGAYQPDPGLYYVWVKLTDGDDVVYRRSGFSVLIPSA